MSNQFSIELVGMMDSPFVRKVAIALTYYGLPFKLTPYSVYRETQRLSAINPLLTVPMLRCGAVTILDSKTILNWIDSQVPEPSLIDSDWLAHNRATAAADVLAAKAGELYRETALRASELHSSSAIARVQLQLESALDLLNRELLSFNGGLTHSHIAIATSYRFAVSVTTNCNVSLPELPQLQQWCLEKEQLPVFLACNPD